jgi:hypothetical protein
MDEQRRTKLCTDVRDNPLSSSDDTAASVVLFTSLPDVKGQHPRHHLKLDKGALQDDAYARF